MIVSLNCYRVTKDHAFQTSSPAKSLMSKFKVMLQNKMTLKLMLMNSKSKFLMRTYKFKCLSMNQVNQLRIQDMIKSNHAIFLKKKLSPKMKPVSCRRTKQLSSRIRNSWTSTKKKKYQSKWLKTIVMQINSMPPQTKSPSLQRIMKWLNRKKRRMVTTLRVKMSKVQAKFLRPLFNRH